MPNKSLALVISALVSFVTSSALMQKIMLIANGTSFGIQDPIFGLDIAYYMFQKPVIETLALYFVILFVGLSIYIALYYVIAFNRYFDGVDGKMLKESLFMKKLTRNAYTCSIILAFSINLFNSDCFADIFCQTKLLIPHVAAISRSSTRTVSLI